MSGSTPGKVALITGAGSGIGLAVTKYLHEKGWRLCLVDLSEERGQIAAKEVNGIFTKADVTRYDDQAIAFQKTWETYGQLDFVYANAGIVDTADFYAPQSQLPPPKPTLLCQEVCLSGDIFSTYLAMHYMRQNKTKGGIIIMTSSAAGIYPSCALPVYTGAKHGVVGFMRSIAPKLIQENIRVNCTLPGAVRTNLVDDEAWKAFPADQFTTTENVVDVVARILNDESIVGKAVEISKDKWYYRDQHEFCDEAQAQTMGVAGQA